MGVGWILRFLLGQAPEGTAFYTPYPLSSNVWLLSVAPDAAFDVFVSVGMILAAIGQSKRSFESKRR